MGTTHTEAQPDNRSVGADLIVFNAKITTQILAQPEASAVAVKRGRIYAVGSDAEIYQGIRLGIDP